MSEWWTYRLSDFLMFTSGTYFRLFELSNRQWWPLQLVFILAGSLTIYFIARRPSPVVTAAAAMLFGFTWIWVAWEFHWQRYAPIMLAAPYFAGLFVLQGAALAIGGRFLSAVERRRPLDTRLGLTLLGFGLAIQPMAGLLFGRPVSQLQLFGLAPDPTVSATLGFLFYIRASWTLFVLPLLWCVVTTATLSTLQVPDTWVMLAVGVATLGGLIYRRVTR
jgi:hypothetical protein